MTETPTVTSGHINALRLFDIANAIDLARAEDLWSSQDRQGARSRLTGTPPKAVSFGDPPLGLVLPPAILSLAGKQIEAQVTARLYVFGAVTLSLRVPADGYAWLEFSALVNAVDAAIGPGEDAKLWADMLELLRTVIGPAMDRPGASPLEEDYLIATVHSFDRPVAATSLGTDIDLVPLLSGEHRRLAETSRADLLARRFSYYTDDLVVLTWDRAFIYEPRRDTDVADVLEVANAQLELRAAPLRQPRPPALWPGCRSHRTHREGRQCAASNRGRVFGQGLHGGAGSVSSQAGQRCGRPQAGHYSRYLPGAV